MTSVPEEWLLREGRPRKEKLTHGNPPSLSPFCSPSPNAWAQDWHQNPGALAGEEGIPLLPTGHLTGSPEGWGVPMVLEETPAGELLTSSPVMALSHESARGQPSP